MIARRRPDPLDPRRRMIRETEAFLSWALAKERHLPRIPRRRVDQGGFTTLLGLPRAKLVVNHWWGWALDRADH